MLKWIVLFFALTLVTAFLGFSGFVTGFEFISRVAFFVSLMLLSVSLMGSAFRNTRT